MQNSDLIDTSPEYFRSTVVNSLHDACVALFADYDLSLLESNLSRALDTHSSASDLDFVAMLSMTNPEVRLSIALQTERTVLEDSFPSEETMHDDRVLQDWIGELSNQLSGRMKNKLLPFGCCLDLGIPTVIQGENLHLDLPRRSEISQHTFITESGQAILISLTTLVDPDFRLVEQDISAATEVLDEGEMLFF